MNATHPSHRRSRYTVYNTYNGAPTSDLDLSNDWGVHSDSVSYGANWPDWKYRIRNGLDTTTSASGEKSRFIQSYATLQAAWQQWGQSYTEEYVGHMGHSFDPNANYTMFISAVYNAALMEFVSKARKAQYAFQAGVALGELRETIRLLKRPLTSFRSLTRTYFDGVKKSHRRWSPREIKNRLADSWLTYRFGIVPLLHDIDDITQDLANISTGRPPMKHVKGFSGDRRITELNLNQSGFTPISFWSDITQDDISIVEETCTIRGKIKIISPSAVNPALGKDAIDLTLSDFVPTLYELIPYSFLVDYFVNLGDFISAITFLQSTVSWANCTRRSTLKKTRKVIFKPGYSPISFSYQTPYSEYQELLHVTKFTRSVVDNFIPDLEFSVPGARKWVKWANMTALLNNCKSIR